MSYNGWVNYETWLVALWLDNDYDTYHYVNQQAQRMTQTHLSDWLESYVRNRCPLKRKIIQDLKAYNSDLDAVDWMEMAEHMQD